MNSYYKSFFSDQRYLTAHMKCTYGALILFISKAGKKGVLIKFKSSAEEAQKCIGHFKIYVNFSVELLLLCERKWAN